MTRINRQQQIKGGARPTDDDAVPAPAQEDVSGHATMIGGHWWTPPGDDTGRPGSPPADLPSGPGGPEPLPPPEPRIPTHRPPLGLL
jgi:hypothetical protein